MGHWPTRSRTLRLVLWGMTPLLLQDFVWVVGMGGWAAAHMGYRPGRTTLVKPVRWHRWGFRPVCLVLGYPSFGETPAGLALLGNATIIASGYVAT